MENNKFIRYFVLDEKRIKTGMIALISWIVCFSLFIWMVIYFVVKGGDIPSTLANFTNWGIGTFLAIANGTYLIRRTVDGKDSGKNKKFNK